MKVFRLSQFAHANDLSGRGAELAGGRWNSIGTPMLYTAESRALCVLEMAVHLPYGLMQREYRLITLQVPDRLIETVELATLQEGWNQLPPGIIGKLLGDRFVLEGKSLALRVPSAVVSGDYNILINPRHPDFSQLKKIADEAFRFDPRLMAAK